VFTEATCLPADELNPTPETRKLSTLRFCLCPRAHRKQRTRPTTPTQQSALPGVKDRVRRRRHGCHSFGSRPRSSPEAAQRGVEDAGLEVGCGPKDHAARRLFAPPVLFITLR
jgi:hypothetical protein